MYDTCFLHCGHAKTGSTSIQNTLAVNRDLIAEQSGLTYPEALDRTGGNHIAFVWRPYVDAPRSLMTAPRIEGALNTYFAEHPGDGGNIAFSSESVSSLKPDELVRLRDDLLGGCRQVKLVIYCRHPLSFAPSFAQTQIKNGKRSLADCCAAPRFVQYSKVLPRYEKVFGRDDVIVRDSSRTALNGGDIVRDFLELATGKPDIADDPDFKPVQANTSLSMTATVVTDYMHRTWPGLGLKNNRVKAFAAQFGGDRFCLPLAARTLIEAEMDRDLAYVAETYGVGLRLDGEPPFADVDYAALLTPEIRAQAAELAAEFGAA